MRTTSSPHHIVGTVIYIVIILTNNTWKRERCSLRLAADAPSIEQHNLVVYGYRQDDGSSNHAYKSRGPPANPNTVAT